MTATLSTTLCDKKLCIQSLGGLSALLPLKLEDQIDMRYHIQEYGGHYFIFSYYYFFVWKKKPSGLCYANEAILNFLLKS